MPVYLSRLRTGALLSCAFLLPLSNPLLAEEPADSAAEPKQLIVTGSRVATPAHEINVPVEVIDRQEIQRRQADYLQDLLLGRPGIAMTRSGGPGALSELRMRGAESNHTLVLLDGVDVNDPALGSAVDLSHLNLAAIDSVEILRGPQSALWGSGALAGVLQVRSLRPEPGTRGGLRMDAGSFGTRNTHGRLETASEQSHLSLSANLYTTDGIQTAGSGAEPNSYDNQTFHLDAGTSGSGWELGFMVRETTAENEYDPTPAPDFLPVSGDRAFHTRQRFSRLYGSLDVTPTWDHSLALHYFDSDNENFADGQSTNTNGASKIRLSWQQNWRPDTTLPQRVTVALERTTERFRQRAPADMFGNPSQNQSISANSVVLEYDVSPIDNLGLTLSLRTDRNSDFDNATTGRLGVSYALPDLGSRLFASYGTGVKNPTFTERFGFTPDTFIGNPDLKPQESTGLQIGLQQRFGDELEAQITLFRDRLEDEIDGFFFDPDLGGSTAINRDGQSKRQGAELFLAWQAIDPLRLSLSYGYLRATEPGNGGQVTELRRPRHSGQLLADWAAPGSPWQLQIGGAYIGESYDNWFATFPATRVTLDDVWLVHLSSGYQFNPQLRVFGRIDNALDEDYQTVFGYNSPGRSFHLGFSVGL